MHPKISLKIGVWFGILFLSIFLLLNTAGRSYLENKIVTEHVNNLYQEAQLITTEYMYQYYHNNTTIEDISMQLNAIDTFLDVRIWALNKNGTIILDTRSTENTKKKNLYTIKPELLEENYLKDTTLNGLLPQKNLTVCYTVSYDLNIRGFVIILEPMSKIHKDVSSYIQIIQFTLVLLAIILIITLLILSHFIVRPIQSLNQEVREYAKGNFKYEMKLKTSDEFGSFATTIQYMADELANLEDYQRKFIANISHDFRSPLTSIKGYAEAMKDGTIPYEIQGKYLDIILFETERLTKLTTNLLTLNNIKHNGSLLNPTSFDLNGMIKNIVATFEGACLKKRLVIELIFESPSALVCADEDKIRQVLYNLIDNAIKFSPYGSKVHLSTEEKNDKLFISVKDHGVGIPIDSIHKIWERFYKTDNSRGRDKLGTGLGLSIVKEIINAHSENITVASTVGVGTEFVFTLPMSADEPD